MKYAIVTFGCRVNQADSLQIERQLRDRGAVPSSTDAADVVIVNSCSVTATADQGARQTLRRIARSNPSVRLVVTGCYATRRPDELSGLPNVVRVANNDEKDALGLTLGLDDSVTTASWLGAGDGPCGSQLEPGMAGRTALTLRVQTGCDEHCSYCIIPRTRGGGRSRPLSAVLQEFRRAGEAGYREVVITGVHLGSYGRDLGDGTTLTALVRCLNEWPDDMLFRIGSLEPMDCTPEIIEIAADSQRIAAHFHLPLQHGSDAILSRMRRPYSSRDYEGVVNHIRTRLPHAAVGTDVIAGFPGENEGHFDQLRRLLESLPLTYVHVFPYSERPGTDASRMAPKVDGSVVRSRAKELRGISERKAGVFRQSQKGRSLRSLVVDDGWSAVTGNYLKVSLTEQRERNTWVDVEIEAIEPLVGRPLAKQGSDVLTDRRTATLDDQLTTCGADVAAATFSDGHREVMVSKDLREAVHTRI